jgi:hypothetical protein
LFSALIDKDVVFIGVPRSRSIFFDVEFEQLRGFGLKWYKPETVPFSKNGQAVLLSIEVVEFKGCDFTGPGS